MQILILKKKLKPKNYKINPRSKKTHLIKKFVKPTPNYFSHSF